MKTQCNDEIQYFKVLWMKRHDIPLEIVAIVLDYRVVEEDVAVVVAVVVDSVAIVVL
jgi:hypothetical protein